MPSDDFADSEMEMVGGSMAEGVLLDEVGGGFADRSGFVCTERFSGVSPTAVAPDTSILQKTKVHFC